MKIDQKNEKRDETKFEEIDEPKVPVKLWCSIRLKLSIIGFFGFINLYALRVNMSVAIVCMTNSTALNYLNSSTESNCSQLSNNKKGMDGEFIWDRQTQGFILSSFFWGYVITQIPGGWLAKRFGGRRVMCYSMLLCDIVTLLTPIGAKTSKYFLIILRFINGLSQGVVYPSMNDFWGIWAPPLERSKLVGFTHAGSQVGNVITFPLSGLLCEYGFAGGWGSIFYLLGIFGIIWCVLWIITTSDSPQKHPRISNSEKLYILSSIGNKNYTNQPDMNIPWYEIFTSKPVWAIIVSFFCTSWGAYLALTGLPSYMKDILKFNIKSNGLFSALPYIAFSVIIIGGGMFADFLIIKGFRTTNVRILLQLMGNITSAIFILITGYIPTSMPYLTLTSVIISVGSVGFTVAASEINVIDIAPPFAGILYSIANVAANIPGFLAPITTGVLTKKCDGLSCENLTQCLTTQWRILFMIAAAIYCFGGIFYAIFADSKIQQWAKKFMDYKINEEEINFTIL